MVNAQLSLFDTATAEVGSLYKAGDWVKLRRKPAIAAWVKRGEIFKVNAVHPIDGRLRFWNPHINQWDFLYPDEVKLAPAPPEIDSVSPASTFADTEYTVEVADTEYTVEVADTEYTVEVADTEYTVEVADTEYTVEVADTEYTVEVADTEYTVEVADTEYTVEVADTEYTVEVADTEYTVEVADTEYTVEVADTEYTVEVADTEYTVEVADTEYTVEVADTEYIVEVAEDDSVSRAISTYRPRGTARSGEYFRFSYRDGSRMRHVHIPGGNIDSEIAQARLKEVRSALLAGMSPVQVVAVIHSWRGTTQKP
ncbi:MAG: hypothetical protein U7126_17235 [Microcoleus sp.]